MIVKHSGTGKEYMVNEETTNAIHDAFGHYDVVSVHNLPLECWRDASDTVVRAGPETTGGPQAIKNGH